MNDERIIDELSRNNWRTIGEHAVTTASSGFGTTIGGGHLRSGARACGIQARWESEAVRRARSVSVHGSTIEGYDQAASTTDRCNIFFFLPRWVMVMVVAVVAVPPLPSI